MAPRPQEPSPSACAVCTSPTGDGALLCRVHTDDLVAELGAVADHLVAELDITITRQARTTPNRDGARSTTTPLPWNEHAAAKRSELWSTLGAWALDVSKLGEDERDRLADVDRYDIVGVAGWLGRNISTLRQHPEAGTAHEEIHDAIREARRAIDRPAMATRFHAGPCPEPIESENEHGVVETVTCDGEVWAFIPIDPQKIAFLRCLACDAGWDTTQWLRIGRRMLTRIEELRNAS